MNRIPRPASLLCAITLVLAVCGEAQPPVVLGATYDLGIAACLGLGGGLSNSEINDLRDCCQDSGCGFVQSTTRIDGHLYAQVSCNCGPDELNGWNYALGDNNDDLAFLECASGL